MVERIVLRKVKNLKELALDMVSTPNYILKSVDWDTVKGTHYTSKYVNQVGETLVGTSLGMREVTIEGWIIAKDESQMTKLKRELNYFVNPQEALDLLYSDYTLQFVPDESVKYSISMAENNEVVCKFQITGTAVNPLFSDSVETSQSIVTTNPLFHFPLVISESSPEKGVIFGERMTNLIINAFNNGTVSTGMRIVFKANGPLTKPTLIRVDTQERLTIMKTFDEGEEVEVNTKIGEKSVKGRIGNGEYTNYFMYKDIGSPWFQLNIGDNLFTYEAEAGVDNLDIFIYFYNMHMEVQECK